MVTRLKETDAVVVGMGWCGSILARELSRAGLAVTGLERGPYRDPATDFTLPEMRDELKYANRLAFMWDTARETLAMRNAPSEPALPMRRLGAFVPASGLGGSGVVWNGITSRFNPAEHNLRSHLTERYGAKAIPAELTVQDWGVSYDELEPYYDKFERLCGTSGQAGRLNGETIPGGNPFEGDRSNPYPNKPVIPARAATLFAGGAAELGYSPFPVPVSNMSAAYTNFEGARLDPCIYCGHCDRFGCAVNAKASPNNTLHPALFADPNFTLRCDAHVKELVYDKAAKKVTAVRYVDTASGEEFEQPAGLVVLAGYVFTNTQLMLLAGIGEPYDPATGKGVVGKNSCYQVTGKVMLFFEDEDIQPWRGTGNNGIAIDDINSDNFDHSGLGFFGGSYIFASTPHGRPIAMRPVPPGTPRWGPQWKRATAKWYNRAFSIVASAANYANRENYLDLDPTYRDALGRPLVRMTHNTRDNDRRLIDHSMAVLTRIGTAMKPTILSEPMPNRGDFSVVPYQTTHNTGGTIMGTDPASSTLNRYLQSWDADNLFVVGGSAFPQNPANPPTGAIGALAYWAADAITQNYLRNPGALMGG